LKEYSCGYLTQRTKQEKSNGFGAKPGEAPVFFSDIKLIFEPNFMPGRYLQHS
jgi:hypothetical protein